MIQRITSLNKLISITFVFSLLSSCKENKKNVRSDEEYYANSAYSYYKKSYNSDNIEDIQYFAKKGMNESLLAKNEAENCHCDEIVRAANEAYTFGKKTYDSENIEDAKLYVKKALNSTQEIISNIEECKM